MTVLMRRAGQDTDTQRGDQVRTRRGRCPHAQERLRGPALPAPGSQPLAPGLGERKCLWFKPPALGPSCVWQPQEAPLPALDSHIIHVWTAAEASGALPATCPTAGFTVVPGSCSHPPGPWAPGITAATLGVLISKCPFSQQRPSCGTHGSQYQSMLSPPCPPTSSSRKPSLTMQEVFFSQSSRGQPPFCSAPHHLTQEQVINTM